FPSRAAILHPTGISFPVRSYYSIRRQHQSIAVRATLGHPDSTNCTAKRSRSLSILIDHDRLSCDGDERCWCKTHEMEISAMTQAQELESYFSKIGPAWQAEIARTLDARIQQDLPELTSRIMYRKPHYQKN